MADKTISDLTQAESIGGEDLFVLQQNGEAKKLKGARLVKYAQDAVGAQVTAATQAAENAAAAKTGAESAQTEAQAARDAILNMIVEAITLESGAAATVEKSLVDSVYKLTFGLPSGKKGDPGATGPANTLTIGTVTSGIEASATITGEAPNQTLNLVLEKGDKGDTGSNFTILGHFDTLAALQAAVPNPKAGDAYGVGTAAPYDIYIWDSVHSKWVNNGNLQGNANFVIAEIPKGRMRGDINGTGKVGTSDELFNSPYFMSMTDIANPDSWVCDINGDGIIDSTDASALQNGKLYSLPFMADFYNSWTYHKVDDMSGYWTTELSIPDITVEMAVSVICGGTVLAGTFIKVETFSGGVRIYANYPPIEALPCTVIYSVGAGGQFIIADTGVSETYVQDAISSSAAKYVTVKLTASGWSEGKEQTIYITGLKGAATKQLIIPTQSGANIGKYYSAGIRISARADEELTFSCETIPTEDITVVLVIIPIFGKFEG